MEHLRKLQRKNGVLLALKGHWLNEAHALSDQTIFADIIVALSDYFSDEGPADLRHRAERFSEMLSKLNDAAAAFDVAFAAAAANAAADDASGQNYDLKNRKLSMSKPENPAFSGVDRSTAVSVSLESFELAQSALEDFVQSYLPFHGLQSEPTLGMIKHLPTLMFVESHIYDLDQRNEDNLTAQRISKTSGRGNIAIPKAPGDDPFGELRSLLRVRGWLTDRLEAELAQGARFWSLERKLCNSLAEGAASCGGKASLLRSDVEEALRLKSFDYRVMNLLLYAMRHEPVNENHMRFLAKSEVLVEIGDDLVDYSDDVEHNAFNVYRCFLAIYGPDKGQSELLQFIREAEAEYAAELSKLEESFATRWRERCAAVQRHGAGSERGPGGGVWDLPAPLDEAA